MHAEGKQRKAQLEAGYHGSGHRNGWQVLCNSAVTFVACVMWSVKFTPDALPWSLLAPARGPDVYYSDDWCPMSPTVADGLSRALVFATLGCVSDSARVVSLTAFSQANLRAVSGTRSPRNWAFCRVPHPSSSRPSRRCLRGQTARSLLGARSRRALAGASSGLHSLRVWSWKTALAEPSGRGCSPS